MSTSCASYLISDIVVTIFYLKCIGGVKWTELSPLLNYVINEWVFCRMSSFIIYRIQSLDNHNNKDGKTQPVTAGTIQHFNMHSTENKVLTTDNQYQNNS